MVTASIPKELIGERVGLALALALITGRACFGWRCMETGLVMGRQNILICHLKKALYSDITLSN